MTEKIISIDFDDATKMSARFALGVVQQGLGRRIPICDFYSRDPALWGVKTFADALPMLNAPLMSDAFMSQPPDEADAYALRQAANYADLIINTSRPPIVVDATEEYVHTYLRGIFRSIHHIDRARETKLDVAQRQGATVHLDDGGNHLFDVTSGGLHGVHVGSDLPWATPQAALESFGGSLPASYHYAQGLPQALDVALNVFHHAA